MRFGRKPIKRLRMTVAEQANRGTGQPVSVTPSF